MEQKQTQSNSSSQRLQKRKATTERSPQDVLSTTCPTESSLDASYYLLQNKRPRSVSEQKMEQPLSPSEPTPHHSNVHPMHSSNTATHSDSVSSPLHMHDIPPAPPSTPASQTPLLSWDAAATPLPMRADVANATFLQQQQLLAEGAATPAPPKPADSKKTRSKPFTDDFSEWAVGDRYELVRMLGRGSYGEVAQAIDKHAGRPDAFVAIKRIQTPFEQEVDAIRLFREIHILRRMRGHECIIQLLGIVQPSSKDDDDDLNELFMIFEYVDTDLYKLIMSPQYLTTEHIQTFLYQMLAGLKYIHSFSVIHRDLKPANILLNEDCSLKICDFGLARIVDTSHMSSSETAKAKPEGSETPVTFGPAPLPGITRQLTKHVVTRWYRAPELILIQPYTSAVDIWSLGCILAELLSMQEGNVSSYEERHPLFPGGTCFPLSGEDKSMNKDERLDQLNVIFKVIGTPSKEDFEALGKEQEDVASLTHYPGKPFETLFPAADAAAIDLLKHMLQFNPKKRFTAAEALEHIFFKSIRRKELEQVSNGPLEGPDFLEKDVDLKVVKRKTLEEIHEFGEPDCPL